MRIIEFQEKYRDDMIFMVLEAKNALGRIPHLNDDLLDIRSSYILRGEKFWLAIDDDDRVIGCIGYNKFNNDTAKLHRLYVKYNLKRQGIGSDLLKTAEQYIKSAGFKYVVVHIGGKEYYESKQFYPKHGYEENGDGLMQKKL